MPPRLISSENVCANIYIQRCPWGTKCRFLHLTMPLYADRAIVSAGRIVPPAFGYPPALGPIFPAAHPLLRRPYDGTNGIMPPPGAGYPLPTMAGNFQYFAPPYNAPWMEYQSGMQARPREEHQSVREAHCEEVPHSPIDDTPISSSHPSHHGRTPSESSSSSSSAAAPSLYSVQSSSTTTLVSPTDSSNPQLTNSPFDEKHTRNPQGGESLHEYYCWAYVQGLCTREKCLSYHPKDIRPYIKNTPCLTYPTCFGGHQCPFKHPFNTPAAQAVLPAGATEHNGATYFPVPLGAPHTHDAPAAYALVMPDGLEIVAPVEENHISDYDYDYDYDYDHEYACGEAGVETTADAGATPTEAIFTGAEETPRVPERQAKKRAHRASVSIASRKAAGEPRKGRHARHKSWAVFEQQ
ncbi:hypothetical protein DENSPDRAFT_832173 [Dentipellis sp. KUC8613]|nr:hypothetical protein DENSPDRAFT_832173 [Dentipellis sp. KUC8613]